MFFRYSFKNRMAIFLWGLVALLLPAPLLAEPLTDWGCGISAGVQTGLACPALAGDPDVLLLAEGRELKQKRKRIRRNKEASGHSGNAKSLLQDCTVCHTDQRVMPENHVATAGMPLAHCRTCHQPEQAGSLDGKMPLTHVHALTGLNCTACHTGQEMFEEPEQVVCIDCHGSADDIAKKTNGNPHANPHQTPHGPPFAECGLCHMAHEESVDFCATCHDFGFKLP